MRILPPIRTDVYTTKERSKSTSCLGERQQVICEMLTKRRQLFQSKELDVSSEVSKWRWLQSHENI
jgi:hypothetical protein